MKRILISLTAFVAILSFGSLAQKADAQGFHFQTRRVHVDIGNSHGYYGGGGKYWGGGYGSAYGGRYRSHGHSDWHDTSHLDYHPGGYQRHYNHHDYVPQHYDVHSSGHWDPHF
jgi:hypothetical protein